MSTTSKGSAFETRVYAALARELAAERLLVSPERATLFRNKGYMSKDRGTDILTDLSIEALFDRSHAAIANLGV